MGELQIPEAPPEPSEDVPDPKPDADEADEWVPRRAERVPGSYVPAIVFTFLQ